MGTIDNGSQKLSYDFREKGQAEVFNKINYKLHSKGIYAGGTLTKVSDSSVEILPFYSVVEDSGSKISVRIETSTNALVSSVSSSTPWIIGRFEWLNTDDNFMDFFAVAKVAVKEDDIIFGFVDYAGATMTTDFDYTQKSWSSWHYLDLSNPIPPFKVVANEPYDTKVLVNIGGPYFYNGNWIQLSTETESPDFTFPISAFGRKDIVALDYTNASNSDVSINIIQGSSTGDLPEVPAEYFPIAIVSLPSGATEVKGEYIKYLNPLNTLSSKETATNILTKIKTVDGAGSSIDLDTLGGQHGDWYKDEINGIIDYIIIDNNLSSTVSLAIAYGNGIYVATPRVNTSQISYASTDGKNWTSGTMPRLGNYVNVAYGNGVFVTIIDDLDLDKCAVSSNGITWIEYNLPTLPLSYNRWIDITYGHAGFIAIAYNANTVARSTTNGQTWSSTTLPLSKYWNKVLYGNGIYIILFGYLPGTNTAIEYYTSVDGITWIQRTMPINYSIMDGVFDGNKFLLVQRDSNIMLTSTDGINWSQITLPYTPSWRNIAYTNGVLIANTSDGYAIKSTDGGITWKQIAYIGDLSGGNNIFTNGFNTMISYLI